MHTAERKRRAVIALGRLAKNYPAGTASLFDGAGIPGDVSGQTLANAITSGRITAGQLYDHTHGSAFNAYSDVTGGATDKQGQQNQANKGKFENIMNTLLGTAGQVAQIYGQCKTAGQPSAPGGAPNQPAMPVEAAAAAKKTPWALIGAAVGVLVILVVVLVMIRKK